MLVIAFHNYITESGDIDFLKKHFNKLSKIFHFLEKYRYKSELLREGVGGGWAEGVLKRGAIAFTNICYVRSLECFRDLSKKLGKADFEKEFHEKYERVKAAINQKLWSDGKEGFYIDWQGFNRHHYFASDSNILSILWDVVDRNNIKYLDKKLDKLAHKSKVPMPVAESKYFIARVFFLNLIGGLKNYHIDFSWSWLGSAYALAKLKIGQKKEAIKILEKIAYVIVRDKTVSEVYFSNKPVEVMFYESEKPWAWGAGMFLYACSKAGFKVK